MRGQLVSSDMSDYELWCPYHGQVFSDIKPFKTHMKEKHQIIIESKYQRLNFCCIICEKKFSFNFQRVQHLKSEHQIDIQEEVLNFPSLEGKFIC